MKRRENDIGYPMMEWNTETMGRFHDFLCSPSSWHVQTEAGHWDVFIIQLQIQVNCLSWHDIWGVFLFLSEKIYKRILFPNYSVIGVSKYNVCTKCTHSTNRSISNLKKIIFKQRSSKDVSVGVSWTFFASIFSS